MPDAFVTFMWFVGACAILMGGIYFFIEVGWKLYHAVQLMETRRKTDADLIYAQAEHKKKLLDLEFQKAKAMNDEIAAATKE